MTGEQTLFATLQRLQDAAVPCALVTVVRCETPTSARPGQKAVVTAEGIEAGWIGGGCAQPAVLRTVAEALEDGQPQLIRVSPRREQGAVEGLRDFHTGCASGGTLDLFVDPVLPAPALRVYGASPAARHLAVTAAGVGFAVQAVAPDTTAEAFAGAVRHADDWRAGEDWPAPRFAVVATQGRGDRPALEAALASGAERIGFIASRRKFARLREQLAERGHHAARLDAIKAPAGLDLGARTPEEIAITVLAELIAWRRGGAVDSGQAPAVPQPAATPGARAGASSAGCCGGG
ncbi:XdhC family protein [Spiribacter halobius]|uniref:XdhC /CoxI family-like protein n=1 Tax=Sediminicurvatus halobius TaxID=2182432 RepID=A0A2U2N010_9GAMM|nr:XdhC family protein [Spiribacter halobius]PWG62387.1 XdhC /CoxI family-like protein [Spiribacter halobius]UEX79485.1 XdhC family protein [Spiribacter halobius]